MTHTTTPRLLVSLAALIALSSCAALETPPDYAAGPCDEVPGVTPYVYVCEDGQSQGVIFMDPEGGDDAGDGTREAPVASLVRAYELATEDQELRAVAILGSPTLTGPVDLLNGVSLVGGWGEGWRPDDNSRPIITSADTVDEQGQLLAVRGKTLDRGQTLAGLNLQVVGDAGPLIGLLCAGCVGLSIERVTIEVGDAADGADGMTPAPGADGARGADGGDPSRRQGGVAPSAPACPDARGGDGGTGGAASSGTSISATAGDPSPLGATGGPRGLAGDDGGDGRDGRDGGAGAPGRLDTPGWIPGALATRGEAGEDGRGGGGGGGGRVGAEVGTGGGGGSGGNGGCGGEGGEPGQHGHPAIGLALIDSQVTLHAGVEVRVGDGGDAGSGAQGAPGGRGAPGGVGAQGLGSGAAGGAGGDGGAGGTGGRGGDGIAAPSYAIACTRTQLIAHTSALTVGQGGLHIDGERADAAAIVGCTTGEAGAR